MGWFGVSSWNNDKTMDVTCCCDDEDNLTVEEINVMLDSSLDLCMESYVGVIMWLINHNVRVPILLLISAYKAISILLEDDHDNWAQDCVQYRLDALKSEIKIIESAIRDSKYKLPKCQGINKSKNKPCENRSALFPIRNYDYNCNLHPGDPKWWGK